VTSPGAVDSGERAADGSEPEARPTGYRRSLPSSGIGQFRTDLSRARRPISLYLDWLDGIRAYCERKEGADTEAGFSAAAALGGLAAANATNVLLTIDALTRTQHHAFQEHFVSKLAVAAVAVTIEGGHMIWAQSRDFYKRSGPPRNSRWASSFRLYAAATLGWTVAIVGWFYLAASRP
jgi:hypothetical protein